MKLSCIAAFILSGLSAVAFAAEPALKREGGAPPKTSKRSRIPSETPWTVRLQTDVAHVQRGFRGEFALLVKDLKTGEQYSYNASTPMYLASGIKVPVMMALYKEVSEGRMSLDDELVLGPDDIRDGAPLLNYLRVGTPVTLRILLEAMIQQSDNAATDMIIDHIGVDTVNEVLPAQSIFGFGRITTLIDVRRLVYRELDTRTAGLSPKDIFRLRLTKPLDARLDKLASMLDEPAGTFTAGDLSFAYATYYARGYNSAPMTSMAALLERIATGQAINKKASREMLDIMLGTQTGVRRIRGGLGPDVPLAHKTGTQYRRTCDFGIFYLADDHPVIFAISVKGGSRRAAEGVMSRLARKAHAYLNRMDAGDDVQSPDASGIAADELELLDPESRGAPKKRKSRRKSRARRKTPKKKRVGASQDELPISDAL